MVEEQQFMFHPVFDKIQKNINLEKCTIIIEVKEDEYNGFVKEFCNLPLMIKFDEDRFNTGYYEVRGISDKRYVIFKRI